MDKIILDLCGGTGAWSNPYKKAGYDVRVITLPDYDIEKWREYPDLVELVKGNKVYGILAAPPCTMFSIARNDTTAREKRDLRKGMATVNACLDLIHECLYYPFRISDNSLQFWALENPQGYLNRFLGKPALKFHPYEFGDPYTKQTCLWGMFSEPVRTPVEPQKLGRTGKTFVKEVEGYFKLKEHQLPEGYKKKTGLSNRTIFRSITPEGFANAFFKSNQ